MRYGVFFLLAGLTAVCGARSTLADTVEYQYRVVASYPHATDVFTQGLVYLDDKLYESAGQYGESRLLVRSLEQVKPLLEQPLSATYFGEGITILGDKIFQLTWRARRGFIYRRDTLEPLGEFRIDGEGWGITHNGKYLIVSDGSDRLAFLDADTFATVRSINVVFDGRPLRRLNELEWIDGRIYANVWGSNWIVIINPDSGAVEGKVRLNGILPRALTTDRTDVLNGIAYDNNRGRLLVTGKYWPRIYHIELLPADAAPVISP